MKRDSKYATASQIALAAAVVLAASAFAAEPAPPSGNPPKPDSAGQPRAQRPGDGVEMKETALPPLVAVQGADGRIVVQHSADAVTQEKKGEGR